MAADGYLITMIGHFAAEAKGKSGPGRQAPTSVPGPGLLQLNGPREERRCDRADRTRRDAVGLAGEAFVSAVSQHVLAIGLALCAASHAGPAAAAWLWTQSDWTGGAYESATSVDPEIQAGELVLANDPDRLVLAFDASDWNGIWALEAFQGRLYLGACDFPNSTYFGDILIYDCATDSVTVDIPVTEEGINVLKLREGMLFSPGTDALGDVFIGNIYYNPGDGWTMKSTVPIASHVFDLEVWQDKLWVTTGCHNPPDYPGILYSSDDMGDTWSEEIVIETYPGGIWFRRLYGLGVWNGSLFVNSDFEPPQGKVVYELTGTEIIPHTIAAPADDCFCTFAEWNGKLACLTRSIVDFYDGQTWTDRVLPASVWSHNFSCRAMEVYAGRLYIGGYEGLVSSCDPEGGAWTFVDMNPASGREIEDLAVLHGRLYAGTLLNAEVYVTPAASSGTLVSEPYAFPSPICTGALGFTALEPPGTDVRIQLRSAASEAELAAAPFLGPDGTAASWYEESETPLSAAHCGHRWFQYRALLQTADERLAPVLEEFALAVDNTGTGSPDIWPGSSLWVWPNPFTAELRIALTGSPVAGGQVRIYDLRGRCVRDLGSLGTAPLRWDGRDAQGRQVSAGVYLLRAECPGRPALVQRIVRLR